LLYSPDAKIGQIALDLGLTEITTKRSIAQIIEIFGVRSRAEALFQAIRYGFVSIGEVVWMDSVNLQSWKGEDDSENDSKIRWQQIRLIADDYPPITRR
jgi:hypothetical protein